MKVFFSFLHLLWLKIIRSSSRQPFHKILFFFLCLFEPFYRIGFFFSQLFQKRKGQKQSPFKVVSIGNISAGGTGKSVFCSYLITSLSNKKGAVILRGYGGSNEKSGESRLVSDGNKLFCDVSVAGDEAYMLSLKNNVPVVIGKNRYKSSCVLQEWAGYHETIDYILLDDAYQNHTLKKDLEILLLDARKPFENNHCFPAGMLREKDVSRADIVIFTHADKVLKKDFVHEKKRVGKYVSEEKIFTGFHKKTGLMHMGNQRVDDDFFQYKRVIAAAGIGSFSGFLQGLGSCNLSIEESYEYKDHYTYTCKDIRFLANRVLTSAIDGVVTTRKDWCKIEPLLTQLPPAFRKIFFVLDVEFSFTTLEERRRFFSLFCEKFGWGLPLESPCRRR